MRILGFEALSGALPVDLNDVGQVAIQYNSAAAIWTVASGRQFLGSLGGQWTFPSAINEAGHVVGWGTDQNSMGFAFLWTPSGGMRNLGQLGGGPTWGGSLATGINDRDEVVGQSATAARAGSYRAFLWTEATGMRDLGTLGGDFSYASDINNRGEVVGYSLTAAGEYHAF